MAAPFKRIASFASIISTVILLLGKSCFISLHKSPISTAISTQFAAEKAAPLPPDSSLAGAFVRKSLLHERAYSSNSTTFLQRRWLMFKYHATCPCRNLSYERLSQGKLFHRRSWIGTPPEATAVSIVRKRGGPNVIQPFPNHNKVIMIIINNDSVPNTSS